jgi:hypothetical protein
LKRKSPNAGAGAIGSRSPGMNAIIDTLWRALRITA